MSTAVLASRRGRLSQQTQCQPQIISLAVATLAQPSTDSGSRPAVRPERLRLPNPAANSSGTIHASGRLSGFGIAFLPRLSKARASLKIREVPVFRVQASDVLVVGRSAPKSLGHRTVSGTSSPLGTMSAPYTPLRSETVRSVERPVGPTNFPRRAVLSSPSLRSAARGRASIGPTRRRNCSCRRPQRGPLGRYLRTTRSIGPHAEFPIVASQLRMSVVEL